MTTTIAPLAPAQAGFFVRLFYRLVRRRLGRVPAPMQVKAHNQRSLWAYGMFEYITEGGSVLAPRLKAIANLRTAMLVGCRFCIDLGSAHAAEAGLTRRELEGLVEPAACPEFDSVDRDVLGLTASMTQTPAVIERELVVRLEATLGKKALVELTAVIAWENYRARFNHAFGATEEGFSEQVCMIPTAANA